MSFVLYIWQKKPSHQQKADYVASACFLFTPSFIWQQPENLWWWFVGSAFCESVCGFESVFGTRP